MNRNTGFRKLALFFIYTITTTTTVFGQTGNAPVQSGSQFPGPFAIDGFLQRQGAAGDWLAGPGGNLNNFLLTDDGKSLGCLRFIDKYNSASDEVFSKGYMQDDPNTMKWSLRRATSKTDMNNILFFVAQSSVDNHIWLMVGADRRSTGKNSSIDIEFLQNQVVMTGDINTAHDKGFYSAGPDGGRTIGDLIISINFQNSNGSSASIQYFRWDRDGPSSFRYFPIDAAFVPAFTAVNSVEINVPFGAFGSTTYPPFTFVEAAIDLGSALGGPGGSVWVKSKSNDNFDDFYPPIQSAQAFGFKISTSYIFYDLYTAQLNADISPYNPADYNFHWKAEGATNGLFFDKSVTGSLNNYDIPDPIFTADTNYNCISYVYKLTVSAKSNPGIVVAQTYLVINSPCKIGKPINPDQMNQSEILSEETFDADIINVFPNPARSSSAITLSGDNSSKDIKLIDINGAVIQQWSGTSGNNLKLKDVADGIYLLSITSKKTGKTIVKKLVIGK